MPPPPCPVSRLEVITAAHPPENDGQALSAWPHHWCLQHQGRVTYVLAADHGSLPIYFAIKGRHRYALANPDALLDALAPLVQQAAAPFDRVVIPHSRIGWVHDLALRSGKPVSELVKRSKHEVCERAAANARWNKAERASQANAWATMGETFTVHAIKSNQRAHYVPLLFESLPLPDQERVLLLDDFIMSGGTIAAMEHALGRPGVDLMGVFFQTSRPARCPLAQKPGLIA